MRILVTGAAGFIGSHIVDALRAAGHEVQGLDSLAPAVHDGPPGYLPAGFDLTVGDIRDPGVVGRAVAGADAVCHQAAMVGLGVDLADLPAYADVNVTGTAVLLEAMGRSGIPRLVLASSMVVYGEGAYDCRQHGRVRPAPRGPDDLSAGQFEPRCPDCGQELTTATVAESAPLDPRNAYAASKVAQEHLAATWARMTGGSAVALRYHNVYGPRMPRDTPYSGVAAIFRSALESGRAPEVFEDGGQRRDFVHVHDVAQANLRALGTGNSGAGDPGPGKSGPGKSGTVQAFNIASGEPHTVGQMAEALAAAFGGPPPVVTGKFRLGDVRHIVASPAAAERGLGFRAEVSFGTGMAEFAQAPLREPASLGERDPAGRPPVSPAAARTPAAPAAREQAAAV
jgi:dTDP-L-rhamnose 4-epimerase